MEGSLFTEIAFCIFIFCSIAIERKHPEKPWIRYIITSPSRVIPTMTGAWVAGTLRATSVFGPVSENLAAKLSAAFKLAKWLVREKNLRPMAVFTQSEKNRLGQIRSLEQRDGQKPEESSETESSDFKKAMASRPTYATAVEVCDDVSFCRLLVALHKEKIAAGIACGHRSLAVSTSTGNFLIRLMCLERSYKPSLCYQLATLIAGATRTPAREGDTSLRLPVPAGGCVSGIEDLLGNHWIEVGATKGRAEFVDLEKQLDLTKSLAAQAVEAWTILSTQRKEREAQEKHAFKSKMKSKSDNKSTATQDT